MFSVREAQRVETEGRNDGRLENLFLPCPPPRRLGLPLPTPVARAPRAAKEQEKLISCV